MGGQSQSASSSTTESTVNTVTDSFNQAFSSTEALSDIGNINITAGESGGGLGDMMLPILIIGAMVVLFLMLKQKKG